jgi:hypothetical protein
VAVEEDTKHQEEKLGDRQVRLVQAWKARKDLPAASGVQPTGVDSTNEVAEGKGERDDQQTRLSLAQKTRSNARSSRSLETAENSTSEADGEVELVYKQVPPDEVWNEGSDASFPQVV